jgi:hypothetical protein
MNGKLKREWEEVVTSSSHATLTFSWNCRVMSEYQDSTREKI